MNEDTKIRELLQSAVGRYQQTEPARDLWPAMLRRLEATEVRITWAESLLAALTAVWLYFFPQALVGLLYQM